MPPDVAQRILREDSGDLKARLILNDLAEWLYNHNQKAYSATLIHAYAYLEDRDAYIANPWPKGCIRMEVPR